ncbi:hypothetical protein HZ326_26090 [Fusarium oxysporum f. sp. albedinis]|nr:hypothetical protein HZ326_26090 [Fusarium oxysporum f. sp. albedinis]
MYTVLVYGSKRYCAINRTCNGKSLHARVYYTSDGCGLGQGITTDSTKSDCTSSLDSFFCVGYSITQVLH